MSATSQKYFAGPPIPNVVNSLRLLPSSIRTIFFRRPKSFQVHQNRAEAFVVHLGDTISSPSEAASSAFARPGALSIDVLDALDDLSTSLPVVTAAEADAATS